MRLLTTIAVLMALALASPIYAQSPGAQLPPDVTQAPGTLPDQTFTSVAVIDIEDLPPEIRSEVDAVITQTSSEDLYILQSSIDATPPAVSALAAVGLDSSHVVAANIGDDGTLTLIIQTTT